MTQATDDKAALARDLINQAYSRFHSGDMYDAQVALARAFQIQPGLLQDQELRSLAARMTGLSADEAIRRLTTPATPGTTGKSSAGDNPKAKSVTGTTWLTLILEFVVLFAISALSFLVIQALARQFVPFIIENLGPGARSAQTSRQLTALLTQTQSSAVLLSALSSGGSVVIAFTIYNVITWAFSAMALGGTGNIIDQFSANLWINIITTIVTIIAIVLFVLAFRNPPQINTGLTQLALLVLAANALGGVIATIYYMMRVHEYDVIRAIVAVLLSPLILACGCGLLITVASAFSR